MMQLYMKYNGLHSDKHAYKHTQELLLDWTSIRHSHMHKLNLTCGRLALNVTGKGTEDVISRLN